MFGNNPWYFRIGRELIKARKPCLQGDYIHMYNWSGCFKVHAVYLDYFVVYKYHNLCKVPWNYYKCHKGEGTSEKAYIRKEIKALESLITIQIDQNRQALVHLKRLKAKF